ncbi:MAG: PAS domain S-box protein [Candidatus Moduliflexus flocculans]|nr:PAS domain S-box protein [Candidatus Moduliflexus flocculans]
MNGEGRAVFASASAARMLGYGEGELIGRPVQELIALLPAGQGVSIRGKAARCPRPWRAEPFSAPPREMLCRRDGSRFAAQVSATPLRTDDAAGGAVTGVHRPHRNPRDGRADAAIYQNSADGFVLFDDQARPIDCNPALQRLFKLQSPKEFVERFFELSPPRQPDGTPSSGSGRPLLESRLRNRLSALPVAARGRRRQPHPLRDHPGADDAAGKPAIFGNIHDVGELKKAEAQLRQARAAAEAASKAKGDFLANMSHEIRTPMNAILGMAHLALKTELTPKQRDYLEKIQTAGTSLLGIINDILDFSKIEAGKLEMEAVPFNLDEVLDNLASLITVKAHEKEGIEVLFCTDPRCRGPSWATRCGWGRCSSIWPTMPSSSPSAARSSCPPNWSSRRGADAWRSSSAVKDTGIGLTEEQKARLFELLLPGRHLHHPQVRRHRAGAGDLQAAGGDDGRPDLGGKRARPGQHLLLHRGLRHRPRRTASPGTRRRRT